MEIILVGGGKLIYHLTINLISKGHFVTIVNRDQDYCREIARELNARVICGEASNPRILEEAGAYKADLIASLTQKDHDNLFVCSIARKYFGIERTTALVNNPDNERLFKKLGIESIFNITQLLSTLLEQNIVVDEINNLLTLEGGKLSVSQLIVPEEAPSADKTLKEIDLPLSIVLGGIIRNGDIIIPRGGTKIKPGDKILIISLPEEQANAFKILGGDME